MKRKREDICSICFEETDEDVDCGHFFHSECIKKWIEMVNTCPLCRKKIDKTKPIKRLSILNNIQDDEQLSLRIFEEEQRRILLILISSDDDEDDENN